MKIEGRNAVEELVKSCKAIDKIIVQEGTRDREARELLALIKSSGIKVQFADKSALDRQSVTRRHQGFIAFAEEYEYAETEDILNACTGDDIVVVLDGIVDPHNLGSIIRVCECAGVKGIIIGKNRSAGVTENVIRISEGSANHMKIAKVTNINSTIDEFKEKGFWAYALEVGGQSLYSTDLTGKALIVVGGEDTGVGRLTRQKCDVTLEIPLAGKVNSLNASVACGIAVFESVRQRRAK